MITKQGQPVRVLQLIAPNTLGGAERVVLSIQEWLGKEWIGQEGVERGGGGGREGGEENRQSNRHLNYDIRHLHAPVPVSVSGLASESGNMVEAASSRLDMERGQILNLYSSLPESGDGEGEVEGDGDGEGTEGNFASSLGIFTWVKKPENAFLREVSARRYPHVIFPMRFAFDWANLIQLFRYIKANRIQLLHTHGYRSDILGLMCAKAARIPVVTTLHGWTASDWMVRRYEDIQRLGLPFFTAIIAVSEEIKDRLVRQGGVVREGDLVRQKGLDRQGGVVREGGVVRQKGLDRQGGVVLQRGLVRRGGLIRQGELDRQEGLIQQGGLIQQKGLVGQGDCFGSVVGAAPCGRPRGAVPSFKRLDVLSGSREAASTIFPQKRESILDRLRGIDPAKITVLQNAVSIPQEAALNIQAQAAERGKIRQQFGCDPDALVIGFVGRLSPEKNPADALKATSLLAPLIPNIICWVVGEGPERSSLENQAKNLGITRRVRFLGFQAHMSSIYQALDVLAITSRTEGTPMALLEAMSWSIPVVSYRVGGIGALLEHGVDGLLVNPGDTDGLAGNLKMVLRDPALSQELGKSAREKVRARFAMDGWIQKIREVYERCLERNGEHVRSKRGEGIRASEGK